MRDTGSPVLGTACLVLDLVILTKCMSSQVLSVYSRDHVPVYHGVGSSGLIWTTTGAPSDGISALILVSFIFCFQDLSSMFLWICSVDIYDCSFHIAVVLRMISFGCDYHWADKYNHFNQKVWVPFSWQYEPSGTFLEYWSNICSVHPPPSPVVSQRHRTITFYIYFNLFNLIQIP